MEFIQYETRGPVGVLTLNRPDCLNAVNFKMAAELTAWIKDRMHDTDTRVIVLTGAGKGFCAGLDIRDPEIVAPAEGFLPDKIYDKQKSFSDMIVGLRRIPQPLVAAVNGAAAGAGFSFALACDICLAGPKAKFSAAYINIGVGGADLGSSWLFPRHVGVSNAARYLYTGDLFDAAEAHRMGLVQEIVEPDQLLEKALALAENMAAKNPLGLKLTKEALNANAGGKTLEDAVLMEDRNQALCITQFGFVK